MSSGVLIRMFGVALTAVLCVGCADDGASDGSTGATTSAPTGASSSPTGAEESESAFAADPATGRRVRLPEVTYRLPDGTRWLSLNGYESAATVDGWRITFGVSFSEADLDYAADLAIETSYWNGPTKPVAQEPRTVDGVEGYVVEAVDRDGFFYEFGIVRPRSEKNLFLTFEFPDDGPYYRDLVESVLASVQWR